MIDDKEIKRINELAKKYDCHITGLDIDKKALEKAKNNIEKAGVEKLISLEQ